MAYFFLSSLSYCYSNSNYRRLIPRYSNCPCPSPGALDEQLPRTSLAYVAFQQKRIPQNPSPTNISMQVFVNFSSSISLFKMSLSMTQNHITSNRYLPVFFMVESSTLCVRCWQNLLWCGEARSGGLSIYGRRGDAAERGRFRANCHNDSVLCQTSAICVITIRLNQTDFRTLNLHFI